MITAPAYDIHVEQLFEKMRRIASALNAAGIPYRVVGGIGIFLHTYPVSPENARMTDDIDLAVYRDTL